jgi:ubiquinol oxidase
MTAPFVDLSIHHAPKGISDRIAFGFTKMLRFCADTFFAKRYGHRAVVLETVAAVPGMVGATINHLSCLRRMCDDKGWIKTLMDEAENERMHLMTFIEVSKPTLFERFVIISVQWAFYVAFFALYLVSAKTAHRVVGYFEEEAVISYTSYLQEIDEGRSRTWPRPRSPSAIGACPTMPPCATWCWWSAPTKRITAMSITASPTNSPACRKARLRRARPTTPLSRSGSRRPEFPRANMAGGRHEAAGFFAPARHGQPGTSRPSTQMAARSRSSNISRSTPGGTGSPCARASCAAQ